MFRILPPLIAALFALVCVDRLPAAENVDQLVTAALHRAGKNRPQLEAALKGVPDGEREGMRFLIANMPQRDLKQLTSKFLIGNVRSAYAAWNESPWKQRIPKDVFLNNVLPYANVSERRDDWRADFRKRFLPLVKDARTPAEAAAALNRKIFPLLKVRYSTKRRRADQGPFESIKSGLASCTGLSVLLIDACRAVGVPARFVGTPLWTDRSGNHSWVEVWDNGWHFTGAAEPSGNVLDRAWFVGRASKAVIDHPQHAIYAVSYKRTPLTFPLVWDRQTKVYAVNVTSRYTRRKEAMPKGVVEVQFRVVTGGDRVSAKLRLTTEDGKLVFEGTTRNEGFDRNDHVIVPLRKDGTYAVHAEYRGKRSEMRLKTVKEGQLVTVRLK